MKDNTILTQLSAITSLDGRYREKVEELAEFISEYALIKTRIQIEAAYLLALSTEGVTRKFSTSEKKQVEQIMSGESLTAEIIKGVKNLEQQTRHDVKAMERTFRALLQDTTLKDQIEMIHIGLTSEDINNIAYRLLIKRATESVCLPVLQKVIAEFVDRAGKYKTLSMLARTHGQPAVSTTLGHELVVFASRLDKQVRLLKKFQLTGKLTGAVGNFNALSYTFPKVDWIKFAQGFVQSFGLQPNLITTQINPYEDVTELFQIYQRINTLLIGFSQDMWRYISDEWFVQEAKKGEVGSSTMPQKVNPIDFENSEGNLGMANAMIEFFSRKLGISRLQRDLSDSTTIRNSGAVLGYCLIGYKSLLAGLSRVKPNQEKMRKDLTKDYAILGEAVQTLLRKEGIADPYSLVASLTRGEHVDPSRWQEWVNDLPVKSDIKKQLSSLTPEKYLGLSEKLTEKAIQEIRNEK